MFESEVMLTVHLEIATKRAGDACVARCPSIDVLSQGKTQRAAVSALKEAVELWFESCVQRGVLDTALLEVGFRRAPDGEHVPPHSNVVRFHKREKPVVREGHRPARRYIRVSVPAYIAS